MKISKILHVVSVVAGFAGIIAFLSAVIGGGDDLVFGISKLDALICAGILMLIAIWTGISTIHHMMLEKRGELV